MRALDLMTREVATVRPTTSVADAIRLLAKHNCTSLPVVDDDDRVIGIVSEIDLLRNRLPSDPRSHHLPLDDADRPDPPNLIADVMTDSVACMSPTADAADLAELMVTQGIRAVPIVDGATLVGIVSRRDLLRSLMRNDDAIRAHALQRLGEYAGEPVPWDVDVHDGVIEVRGRFSSADLRIVDILLRSIPGVVAVHCFTRWTMRGRTKVPGRKDLSRSRGTGARPTLDTGPAERSAT